jgi:hypothetical protein
MMSTNLKPHLADMPFLQPIVTELDALIFDGKSLDSEQEVARKQLADITHRRQEIEKRGEQLRTRISAHLKGSFGYTSDELIQFGISPRPRVVRRKKQLKPAAEPAVRAK